MTKCLRNLLAMAVLALGVAVPVAGQRPALAMLDQLERGRWEIRMRDEDRTVRSLCLGDGRRLIQLRHPAATCERLIVEDDASQITVQYTCRGQGYGRTHIRRETNRLVQIDSQGIVDGLPFAFAAEARRVGDCTG